MDPFRAYATHVNPALGRFLELTSRGTRFVRAQGTSIEDADGNAYDDFLAGFGSLNLGHNPPGIKAAMLEHLRLDAPSLFPESLNPFAGSLAARLIAATNGAFQTAYLCNSGAEAVEAALKTAIAVTGKTKIAYADGGYHGTTLGALACMARGLSSSGPLLIERLFRRRILAQVCGHAWSVVRVEPPLIVSDEACTRFVDAFADAIRWLEENAGDER
jgi:4-aminobutyrate aminotransferase-like enzyme